MSTTEKARVLGKKRKNKWRRLILRGSDEDDDNIVSTTPNKGLDEGGDTVLIRCNGITKETMSNASTFCDIADQVYAILNECNPLGFFDGQVILLNGLCGGRVWAGHNIGRLDYPRIREAFVEIGREVPQPKGVVDTQPLLTQRFGKEAET